jgi:predicted TIM-barrel fold metal-dependent hydrolase
MSTLLERGRAGERLDDVGIVDMHGHLGRTDFTIPEYRAEDLVRTMDRIGVTTSFCTHVGCLSGLVQQGNDEVLEAMKAHPGRILGYVILWPYSEDWVRAETERCLEAGFQGIKLHSANGFPYDHPAYEPAFAMAAERRMPILLHTWGGKELDEIAGMAKRYPEASYLLGHAGAVNEKRYVAMAREADNIHLELCYSMAPRGLVERLVGEAGVDKVVWGSDAVFMNMPQQLGRVLGARLAEEDKRKILSANAKRILSRIRG